MGLIVKGNTIITLQGKILQPKRCSITGRVKYYNNAREVLPEVIVQLYKNDTLIAENESDVNGTYLFQDVPAGTYNLRIKDLDNYEFGGVTNDDATAVNGWGVGPDEIELVKFLAGDVNKSLIINSQDAGLILSAISENDFTLLNNYPFVYYFAGITVDQNPISDPFPMNLAVTDDITGKDIYVLWAGDFDGSWTK